MSVIKGAFLAPKTGNYKFYISGDDTAKLKIDVATPYSPSATVYTPNMVAEV